MATDFLTALQQFESGGRNIPNTTQGTSSGQAQGYNQITTGTWHEFGGDAYAPTPMQATREQQNAIAAKIPMGRWAPETLNSLRSQGFTINPKTTLADNIAANGGTTPSSVPGTTINSTTPGAPTAVASAALTTPASPPPTAWSQFSKGDIGGGLQTMNKSGALGDIGKAVTPPQQQVASMMPPPNLQPHQINPQAAALLASLTPTGVGGPPVPGLPRGALGMQQGMGMGMYNPYMMGMA
jgi:hypothetical protein